jgi:hypothetical protein
MKTDIFTKTLLIIIAGLLLMNFFNWILPEGKATAQRGSEEIGRYQITSWAAQAGAYTHHCGYYIIDTTTGKVVAAKSEVHSPEK